MTKAKKFRQLLQSKDLEFICEVHNGMSAKIVEEAGFKAIWGSGLTMSAAIGVRDSNEASWTQILEIVEFISDATSIPLLLDANTGYGNFNNVRRLVRKLEQRDIAAVCIEDKLFPKKNSYIQSERQPLADIEEFSGKIKAAKNTQNNPDFSVIARVEAFITYYTTHTVVFRQAGFSAVIWANMILRSAIKAMKETATQLKEEESLVDIEDDMASVAEVFRVQDADELEMAEKLYLPEGGEDTHCVILAASQGAELGVLTKDKPKTLLEISGRPLLYKQVDMLNEIGIKDITVVRGFHKEKIDSSNLHYVDNDNYATTQEVFSLFKGIQGIEGRTLISYGDILYKKYVPTLLLETEGDFVLAVDSDWKSGYNKDRYTDFVSCDCPDQKELFDQKVILTGAGSSMQEENICGEWIGLFKLSEYGLSVLQELLGGLFRDNRVHQLRMTELFNELISRDHEIRVVYIRGHWLDVDDIIDISNASRF